MFTSISLRQRIDSLVGDKKFRGIVMVIAFEYAIIKCEYIRRSIYLGAPQFSEKYLSNMSISIDLLLQLHYPVD